MKITIEPYSGGTFTAQIDAEHIEQICDIIKGLLVQVGYHPHNVDEYIHTGGQWFPESNDADPEGSTRDQIINGCKDDPARDYFENEEEYMN